VEYAQYTAYLRAIREHIWFPVLTGGVALLVVIGVRISPLSEGSYTARGRLLVLPIASRIINSSGNELAIGSPPVDAGFWATLVNVATGPSTLERITAGLKLEADAIQRYEIILAGERLAVERANSDVLELTCTSNNKNVSQSVAEVLLKDVCESWKTGKVSEARRVVAALKERVPVAEADIDQAQTAVKEIEAHHGGVAPDREADAVQSSLVATQLALQNADLESTAGQVRSQRLAARPRLSEQQTAATNLALYERIDNLNQEVMNRQAQLADMLSRRTKDHPVVKEIKQQIATLQKRVKELETVAKTTSETPDFIREASIEANAYAGEMATRRDLLAQRERELRDRLSVARTEAVKYQEASSNAAEALKRLLALKGNIASAEAELHLREQSEMIRLLAPAELDPTLSTIGKLALYLLIAAFLGVGLGLAVVVGVQHFDTSFRNEADAARLLGCPVVAGIPHSDVEVVVKQASPTEPPATTPDTPMANPTT
jgi:uncharacterized protein involved in exopolysaccharide biosynthesis